MTSEPPTPPPVRASPWRRRARRGLIVVGVVVACLAMLGCAGVVYIAYDANRAPHEEHDMEAFATQLCGDLLTGNAGTIYAELSAGARDRYAVTEFGARLAARGRLTSCEVVRATYLLLLVAYVVIEDGHGEHTFDLVKEAGEWRVDSDILLDLDSPPRHGGGGGFDD